MNQLPADRASLLTPAGRGAVATLRIDGPRAEEIVVRHFVGPKSRLAIGRVHVGRWIDPTGRGSTEEVVVCRVGPEQFEVHCHGGAAASRRILEDAIGSGCMAIAWRDFTGSEESNSIKAAARAQLADARTERIALILLDQYNGALSRAIDDISVAIEAHNVETALAEIGELLSRSPIGQHLVEPWRVVLAGPPNAGKSSLINALVGYRRAIVHETPGTTRDAVSASAAFDGWPIELCDTAGIRASDDPLESAGIERARQKLAAADLVLLVFDIAEEWTTECRELIARYPNAPIVHNKIDLVQSSNYELPAVPNDRPAGLAISALTGAGIDRLIVEIIRRLVPNEPGCGAAVPFLESQIAALLAAKDCVQKADWRSAIAAIDRIRNESA